MIDTLSKRFGMDLVTQDLVLPREMPPLGKPITGKSKIKKNKIRRILLEELENSSFTDPLTFNAINKALQLIMGAEHRWYAKDKKIIEEVELFMDNISRVGEPSTFEELAEYTMTNQLKFGYGWIELVENIEGSDIVDLMSINPITFDYARDKQGIVLVDDYNCPIGYLVKRDDSYFLNVSSEGDPIPKEYLNLIDKKGSDIFVSAYRIAPFKMYIGSNKFDSYGIIEPAYKSIIRRLNIEEAQANSVYSRGYSPLIDYVGNEKNPPTMQRMQQALEEVKKLEHDRYLALPWYHKIESVDMKQSELADSTMKMLRQNEAASFGTPLGLIISDGEAINRSTLKTQQESFILTLNYVVRKFVLYFNKYVLKPLAVKKKWTEVPKLRWDKIEPSERDDKTVRLQKWVELGTLSPQEMREFVIDSEGLSLDPKSKVEPIVPKNPIKEEILKK